MLNDLAFIRQAFETIFKSLRYTNYQTNAVTGKLDSSGDLITDATQGLAANYIWVRLGNDRTAIPMLSKIRAVAGVDVVTAFDRIWGEDVVLEVNLTRSQLDYAAAYNVPMLPANMSTPTSARDIVPGGVFADSAGGLYVRVGAYWHVGGYWDDLTSLALTPTATSSQKSLAVVGVNRVTNALTYTLTADRAVAINLIIDGAPTSYARTDIQAVIDAAPTTDWRGAVELHNGDTAVDPSRIISLLWLQPTMTGADGATAGERGLVPTPAATDNTKALFGDGTWKAAATAALDNLASVAINTSLISDTDSTDNLGSTSKFWANGYIDTLYLSEQAAPSTPASGSAVIYAKTDGKVYSKDDAGTEYDLTAGAGSGTLDVTDGTTTVTGATAITFTSGATVTDNAGVAEVAITGSGSTHSYLGYDTVGGTTEQTTAYRWIMKKITVSSAGILQSIGVYLKTRSDGATPTLTTCIWEDNSGTPRYIYGGSSPVTMNPDHVSGVGGNAARWIQYPTGIYLAAGDYWIGVQSNMNGCDFYKDGSGSDRYFTSTFAGWEDAGFRAITTTTDRYSIRASFLAL